MHNVRMNEKYFKKNDERGRMKQWRPKIIRFKQKNKKKEQQIIDDVHTLHIGAFFFFFWGRQCVSLYNC